MIDTYHRGVNIVTQLDARYEHSSNSDTIGYVKMEKDYMFTRQKETMLYVLNLQEKAIRQNGLHRKYF